ncbi:MAG: 50S ribosomal protein L9 [Patescibacteria group bacterium]|nr:50S ribosomal protein L9 [Patescibacteria group bacterium]
MPKKIKRDKNIPVVLLEDIPNLGNYGEIKKIRRGFVAFLLRKKKVIVVTKDNREHLEKMKLIAEKNREENLKKLNELKEKIESLVFETTLKVGPNKEVYNSITKNEIISFLKQNGINITKSQIELEKYIKERGEFDININLGYGIKSNLKLIVKERIISQ